MSAPPSDHRHVRRAASTERRVWIERGVDRLIPRSLKQYREQVLYLIVGAWNTLFGYGVFVILYHVAGDQVSYAVIIVVSYVFAIFNAYLGYRYVAFRSHGAVIREFPRFSAVYLLTMVVNLVFFPIALRVLPISGYAVQALFTAGVVIASYLGHRYFSFRVPEAMDLAVVAGAGQERGTKRTAGPEDSVSGGE
jgi:putative flippase GtrA